MIHRDNADQHRLCNVAEDCVLLGSTGESCGCGDDWRLLINQETWQTNPRFVEAAERCGTGYYGLCDSHLLYDPVDCIGGQCVLPVAERLPCLVPPMARYATFHDLLAPELPAIGNSSAALRYDFDPWEVSIQIAESTGLTEGDVVTLQWVFYTNPEACENPISSLESTCSRPDLMIAEVEGSLGYAGPAPLGAQVVDSLGTVAYGYLTESVNTSGLDDPDFVSGQGLLDVGANKIHLMLRTHGPKLDGALGSPHLSGTSWPYCQGTRTCRIYLFHLEAEGLIHRESEQSFR